MSASPNVAHFFEDEARGGLIVLQRGQHFVGAEACYLNVSEEGCIALYPFTQGWAAVRGHLWATVTIGERLT